MNAISTTSLNTDSSTKRLDGRFQAASPDIGWSILALLIAACGGGGGGGAGSISPNVTRPAEPTTSNDERPPITVEPLTYLSQDDCSSLAELDENKRIVDHANRGSAKVESFSVINDRLAELKQTSATASATTMVKYPTPMLTCSALFKMAQSMSSSGSETRQIMKIHRIPMATMFIK
jgi:hypothetical protein